MEAIEPQEDKVKSQQFQIHLQFGSLLIPMLHLVI